MGRPGDTPITTAERLAKVAQDTAGITHKERGKVAVAARTALAVAPTVGAAAGAVAVGKKLAEGSAMKSVEQAQAERRKRKEQSQP